MPEFLLDTDTASRLIRLDRATLTALRRSGATALSLSSIAYAELLYGARLATSSPHLMTAVRRFCAGVTIHEWDVAAAEVHAEIRAATRAKGRTAGVLDLMIAAHALSLQVTLVSSDKGIKQLRIPRLAVVSWW